MTCKQCLVVGAISMTIAVAAGAIGAHLIKSKLERQVQANSITDIERFDISHSWDVAVRMHGLHSLGLIVIGLAVGSCSPRCLRWVGILLLAGIVLFSGVIYLVTATKLTALPSLGRIHLLIPLGGVSWIAGWIVLAAGFSRCCDEIDQQD